MSFNFDLQISNQSEILENQLKAVCYQKLHEASQKTKWIRLSGIGVGIASGFLTVAKQVALICENIIKGLVNVVGAPFFEKCSFSTGMSQFCIGLPKEGLILPFSIFSAALGLITKTINIATRPVRYTHWRWCKHDPVEQAAENKRREKENFYYYTKFLETKPNDPYALRIIAQYLEEGVVVEKDEKRAFELYQKSADLGDVDSMIKFGKYSEEKKEYEEAFKYYDLASIMNRGEAFFLKGSMYIHGLGLPKDESLAVECYREAARKFNKEVGCYLAVLLKKRPDLQTTPEEFEIWEMKARILHGENAPKILADIEASLFKETDPL